MSEYTFLFYLNYIEAAASYSNKSKESYEKIVTWECQK